MEALINMFKGAYKLLDHEYVLPWIGQTSLLDMMIFLALIGFLVDLINGLLGGTTSDE